MNFSGIEGFDIGEKSNTHRLRLKIPLEILHFRYSLIYVYALSVDYNLVNFKTLMQHTADKVIFIILAIAVEPQYARLYNQTYATGAFSNCKKYEFCL